MIVKAAAHILETRGLEGYNTNAIAARAGVSIGSIYQYFPNKDAIMASVIQEDIQHLLAKLGAVKNADPRSNVEKLALSYIEVAVRHQLKKRRLIRIIDFELVRLSLKGEFAIMHGHIVGAGAKLLTIYYHVSEKHALVIAQDIVAITRAMVSTASSRGEVDINNLSKRILKAVIGYASDLNKR